MSHRPRPQPPAPPPPRRPRRTTPAAIRRIIRGARRFLILGHLRPDGDCLGAELALREILRALGKSARIVNHDPLPPPYRDFFPDPRAFGVWRRGRARPDFRPEVVFVLDTPDRARLGDAADLIPPGARVVNIDHHPSNRRFADDSWRDPRMSSASEMIWLLARGADDARPALPLSRTAALGLYIGIATDTGQFAFGNTTPRAHRIAAALLELGVRPDAVHERVYYRRHPAELELQWRALARLELAAGGRIASVALTRADFRAAGAGPEFAREFANLPRALAGVRAAVFFYETVRDPEAGAAGARGVATKASLRTVRGLDANRIAAAFGGGGHARAAGCTIPGPLAVAKRRLYAELRRHLRPAR